MDNLFEILNECEIDEKDVAEMLYAYLCEYGEEIDQRLIIAIYKRFFKHD